MPLTHLNKSQNPCMVDLGQKSITNRMATARGEISMSEEAFLAATNNSNKKGSIIQTSIIAGIMAAKKTSELIPLCHPLYITHANVEINPLPDGKGFEVVACVKCQGLTGVEMEALSAVSVALLTIYDMLKAVDKRMVISNIILLEKEGGKSGKFSR